MTTTVLEQDQQPEPEPATPPRPALGAYGDPVTQARLAIGNNGW